ncbi:MAG: nicotinate (nicotinamide) nucleotide adenylyltransferase [Desulfohalobiaceae bacterium]
MRLGVLGGSFNPVHNGHLRLALEVQECLGLQRVELVPAPRPPHKSGRALMPFELRCQLLQLAVEPCPGLEINLLEAKRPGASYTYYTLQDYSREYSSRELCFILGSNDLLTLPKWYKWSCLPQLASFAVVGRQGLERDQVIEFIDRYFPEAVQDKGQDGAWELSSQSRLVYVQIPRLDISSTLLRQKMTQGLSLAYLVPDKVRAKLSKLDPEQILVSQE